MSVNITLCLDYDFQVKTPTAWVAIRVTLDPEPMNQIIGSNCKSALATDCMAWKVMISYCIWARLWLLWASEDHFLSPSLEEVVLGRDNKQLYITVYKAHLYLIAGLLFPQKNLES